MLAGYPAGTCGTTVTPPPPDPINARAICTSNSFWTQGNTDSPLMNPGTFRYPAKQRWFASGTQMANEPVHVDGGEVPEVGPWLARADVVWVPVLRPG